MIFVLVKLDMLFEMKMKEQNLKEKYPLSDSYSCSICKAFCMLPGWWTIEEAEKAIKPDMETA
jgi:hypothetical protein